MSVLITVAVAYIAAGIVAYLIETRPQKAETQVEGDGADEIVIHYRIRREECPSIFADLAAVPNGPARGNRLRCLALRGFDAETFGRKRGDWPGQPVAPDTRRLTGGNLIDGKVE